MKIISIIMLLLVVNTTKTYDITTLHINGKQVDIQGKLVITDDKVSITMFENTPVVYTITSCANKNGWFMAHRGIEGQTIEFKIRRHTLLQQVYYQGVLRDEIAYTVKWRKNK